MKLLVSFQAHFIALMWLFFLVNCSVKFTSKRKSEQSLLLKWKVMSAIFPYKIGEGHHLSHVAKLEILFGLRDHPLFLARFAKSLQQKDVQQVYTLKFNCCKWNTWGLGPSQKQHLDKMEIMRRSHDDYVGQLPATMDDRCFAYCFILRRLIFSVYVFGIWQVEIMDRPCGHVGLKYVSKCITNYFYYQTVLSIFKFHSNSYRLSNMNSDYQCIYFRKPLPLNSHLHC